LDKNEKISPPLWLNHLKEWELKLQNLINTEEATLKDNIPGHIRIDKKRKGVQFYYLSKKGQRNGKYIPKNKKDFAIKLIQQNYETESLQAMKREVILIRDFMKTYKEKSFESVYEKMSDARKQFVTPFTLPTAIYIENWYKQRCINELFLPEGLKFKTNREELVRSKTEVIIANVLNNLGIPYLYENEIKIGNKKYYPDFTCLNINNRKTFLWEHLGLMDDVEYSEKVVNKLSVYEANGYFPGKNLILTMETKDLPLTPQRIEKIAKIYLQESD